MGLSRGNGLSRGAKLSPAYGLSQGAGLVGGEFNPIAVLGSDLLGYWDATRLDTISVGAGGAVSAWRDIVAGYNAIQATGASQPVYSGTSFAGDPAVTFDGTNDVLAIEGGVAAFPSGTTPGEMWALLSQDADGATDSTVRVAVSHGGTNATARSLSRQIATSVNRARFTASDGTTAGASQQATVDFTGRHVLRGVATGSQVTVFVDGQTGPVTTFATNSTNTRFMIGASSATTTGGSYWKGQIAVVLITNLLSSQKSAALQAWLMGRKR